MVTRLIEPHDPFDQIDCMRELIFSLRSIGGLIATEGQQIADALTGIATQNGVDFGFRVADAGEMRHGVKQLPLPQPHNKIVGVHASGTTRAISYRYKGWLKYGEGFKPGLKRSDRLRTFWREELKAHSPTIASDDVFDVHAGNGTRMLNRRRMHIKAV